jgi:N-acetylglutamate synthase
MSATDESRLHESLCSVSASLADVLEDARFERRDGYTFTTFPMLPIPSFNGVWADEDCVPLDLEASLQTIEDSGIPAGVTVRTGMETFRSAARTLGFTTEMPVPGMAAAVSELRPPQRDELEILRVETADGLAQALAVAAAGFEIPAELLASLYLLEVAELSGIAYYLGRVGGIDVSTAVGFAIDGTVGIFNVATPPEHRGRGYGAALTAHAASEGFKTGADLAWLQSSTMGRSVYARLGFREVETYTVLTRPGEVSPTS